MDEALLAEVRQVAARENRTMGQVIEDAVRESLARRRAHAEGTRVTLPVVGGTGIQPGVDLDDSAALLDLMDAYDEPGRSGER